VDSWKQDITYAIRSIAGAKRFALIVVATLALGIGANTAVFSVLNAVVLRPLPYDEAERLVRVYLDRPENGGFWPALALVALREQSRTVDLGILYTYAPEGADLTDLAQPERVQVLRVSADYFRVLRAQPTLGRVLERSEERGDARVAVVSERIWRTYLGAASDVAGRPLSLNGIVFTVVGVLPEGFDDPVAPGVGVWIPIGLLPTDRGNSWGNHYLSAIARLRAGVTLAQARTELDTLTAALPWTFRREERRTAFVAPLQEDTLGNARLLLWVLLGAVVLLLIIACVNVASLCLARGAPREAEMAIRAALGCSRGRQVRQLMIESLVLSAAGGIAGVLLAQLITRLLLAVAPDAVIGSVGFAPDARLLVFSFGVVVLSAIGFGVAPALQFTRPNIEGALRESGRSGTGSRRQTRSRNRLVISQIALALILLIGAGLLMRSFNRLRAVPLGVTVSTVMTFEVHLPQGRYQDAARRATFHRDFTSRVTSIPGVRAAGAVSRLPVTGGYHTWGTRRADAPPGTNGQADQQVIEGAYFEALRIPLLRGRTFTDADDERAPRRVIVSQGLARDLFRVEDAVGQYLNINGDRVEIIGVVGDVAATARGVVRPMVYHSHRQFAADRNWALTQVVSTDRPAGMLLDDVRRELGAIDRGLVLFRPRLLTDVIGNGVAHERFALMLIASFALLALVLAAVGIYGVLSYSVTRRTHEMGIRMALGAPTTAVLGLVVGDGGRLAAIGVTLGLAGAWAATRTLQSFLYDVSTLDPLVFVTSSLTIAVVAILASWIPALAATRVSPLEAVRADN
jgi:predicted permease